MIKNLAIGMPIYSLGYVVLQEVPFQCRAYKTSNTVNATTSYFGIAHFKLWVSSVLNVRCLICVLQSAVVRTLARIIVPYVIILPFPLLPSPTELSIKLDRKSKKSLPLVKLNRSTPVFCRVPVAGPPPAGLRTPQGGGGCRAFVATAFGGAFVDTVDWSGPVYWPLTPVSICSPDRSHQSSALPPP